MLLTACASTEYVPVTTVKTVDRVETVQVHDSVFCSDTVTIVVNDAGDTIYKDRIRIVFRDCYKERATKDSVHDSVPVIVKVNEPTDEQRRKCETYNSLAFLTLVLAAILSSIIMYVIKKRQ